MNLTGRPVYAKGQIRRKGNKPPSSKHRKYWERVAACGCIVEGCKMTPQIHHCLTGRGGRKDHMKVLPLCRHHHQGDQGIHTLARRKWEAIYGTETELMIKLAQKLLKPA